MDEGCSVERRSLARFAPVEFDPELIAEIAGAAEALGHRVRRMPSGAGHDAQMCAPNCPTAMIFGPSRAGLSHNIEEFTTPEQICAGANVLMQVTLSRVRPLEDRGGAA